MMDDNGIATIAFSIAIKPDIFGPKTALKVQVVCFKIILSCTKGSIVPENSFLVMMRMLPKDLIG